MSVNMGEAVGYLDLDTTKFKNGMSSALSDLKIFKDQSASAADKATALSGSLKGAGKSLSMGLTVPLVGAGVAALKFSTDFGAGMSNVQAITQANTQEMDKMKKAAIDLGATTAFSASEVADGMANLGSAGFTTSEILSAMPGMLDMAASSGADLAVASEIAASALRGFSLDASEAGHVADVFAKAAADTNAGVEDMGEAMKYVAPVANAMGYSIESTAAAVGLLSNAGIKGSQAGTTLRGALSRLAKPSKTAAEAMKALNFEAYDSQGKMKPLEGLIDNLNTSMASYTDQQKQAAIVSIFGQEAMSGMMVLMEAGPDKINEVTKSLENSNGAAAAMAETMQDNLKGSLEELGGAAESLGISVGDIISPAIRTVADALAKFVNWLNNSSEETKKIIIVIAGIVAAIGPLLLIFGTLAGAIANILGLVGTIGGAMAVVTAGAATATPAIGGLAAIFTALTGPIGIAIALITAVATSAFLIVKNWDSIKDFMADLWTKVKNGIVTAWTGIKSFFTTKIPEIIGEIVRFFQELPGKIGYAIGLILGTLVKWQIQVVQWTITNVPKIIESIINFFQELPSKIAGAITKTVTVLGQWTVDMIAKAKIEIPKIVTEMINGFQNLPSKMLQIGKNIIKGLWDGILGMKSWLGDKIKDFSGGIIRGFEKAFEIKSPSRIMAGIGRNITKGLAVGIEESKDSVIKAANNIADVIIEEEKNLQEQLEKIELDAIAEREKESRDAYEKALAEKYEELRKTERSKKQKLLDEIATMQSNREKDLAKQSTENLKQSLTNQLNIVQNFKKEYENAIAEVQRSQDQMSKKLIEFGGLFERTQNDLGEELFNLTDLQSQIDKINSYGDALERLKQRGISDSLLKEIEGMSIEDALSYSAKLLSMTDTSYDEYMKLWEEKQLASKQVATKFYKDEMEALKKEFVDKIPERLSSIKDKMSSIGTSAGQGLADGFRSQESYITGTFLSVLNEAMTAAKESMQIHSPSRKWAEIGKFMAQGLGAGFTTEMVNVSSQINASLPGQTGADQLSAISNMGEGVVNAIAMLMQQQSNSQQGNQPLVLQLVADSQVLAQTIYNPLQQVAKQKGAPAYG